jgi:predicted component of type VI protein secretion system
MQAALSAMLQRFEPKALEKYFEQKGGRSMLESKKSWYWEQYAEKHKELLAEAEDNFQDLFGEEFARAYEEQTAKLAKMRPK